jgi:hypothetical protein
MKPQVQNLDFYYGNELNFIYEHLQFQNFFRLTSARHIHVREDKEGGGEEWEGRGGRRVSLQTQKPNSAYGNG